MGSACPISSHVAYTQFFWANQCLMSSLSSISPPKSLQGALLAPRRETAMVDEMIALRHNHTRNLVALPERLLPDAYGSTQLSFSMIVLYLLKDRRLAEVYTQTYGLHFAESFSPVAWIGCLCVLMAVNLNWLLYQSNVKSDFLQSDSKRRFIWVNLLVSFFSESLEGFCKLKKTLYGIKRAPRA